MTTTLCNGWRPRILGIETPYEKQSQSPFAIASSEDEVPYGSLKLTLTTGAFEYPIENAARLSLLHQMDAFDLQSDDPNQAWIYCWSLDNKILFVNPAALIELELISDDVEQMLSYGHPEVYQALENWDDSTQELGAAVRAGCEAVIERDGEDLALRRVGHVRAVTLAGDVCWHNLASPADTEAYFGMHLEASTGIKPNRMIRTESEGYHRDRYVNLSQIALLEIPMNRYHKLVSEEA